MSAPRIDTFRNVLDSVQTLLCELRPNIEDIHTLAYDRPKAEMQSRVAGGTRDYALDTHGDMRARTLYIEVAARLVGLGRAAEQDLKQLRRFLNQDGGPPLRRDGSADVDAVEFTQAAYARERRLARQEHHPHRLVAQPERKHHLDPTVELEQLRGAVRRMTKRLDEEHTGCVGENGRRKPRWADRSSLSPAQRDAWDRALQRDEVVA